MNILSDYHHSSLFYSMQLLFEKRLGHSLFRQIGMEWWEKGYWAINNLEPTAKQYLEIRSQPTDGTPPLNDNPKDKYFAPYGMYYLQDKHHGNENVGITFEQFEKMNIDIIIASIPQHVKPFKELAKMKNAKFIFQMGNRFNEIINNMHEIPNLMASIKPFPVPSTCNAVFYRQEFPLDIFNPTTTPPDRLITSFINVYANNGGYENYMALRAMMPDWDFSSYGGQCESGAITGIENMAAIMKKSAWGFMVKAGADGYGHVLHNWFACGIPVIINYEEYKKELGGDLLIPGETCLVAEVGQNMQSVADAIQNMKPLHYVMMKQEVERKFNEVVNFENDADNVRQFLTKLI